MRKLTKTQVKEAAQDMILQAASTAIIDRKTALKGQDENSRAIAEIAALDDQFKRLEILYGYEIGGFKPQLVMPEVTGISPKPKAK